jgi:putative membrane protein
MPEQKHEKLETAQRATEYLANERTFLAWIRTSIAVISLGFLVARFSLWLKELAASLGGPITSAHHSGVSLRMGEGMMVLGAVLAVLAARRYSVVNRSIDRALVRPDRWLIVLITTSVVILAAAMALYMFVTGR